MKKFVSSFLTCLFLVLLTSCQPSTSTTVSLEELKELLEQMQNRDSYSFSGKASIALDMQGMQFKSDVQLHIRGCDWNSESPSSACDLDYSLMGMDFSVSSVTKDGYTYVKTEVDGMTTRTKEAASKEDVESSGDEELDWDAWLTEENLTVTAVSSNGTTVYTVAATEKGCQAFQDAVLAAMKISEEDTEFLPAFEISKFTWMFAVNSQGNLTQQNIQLSFSIETPSMDGTGLGSPILLDTSISGDLADPSIPVVITLPEDADRYEEVPSAELYGMNPFFQQEDSVLHFSDSSDSMLYYYDEETSTFDSTLLSDQEIAALTEILEGKTGEPYSAQDEAAFLASERQADFLIGDYDLYILLDQEMDGRLFSYYPEYCYSLSDEEWETILSILEGHGIFTFSLSLSAA